MILIYTELKYHVLLVQLNRLQSILDWKIYHKAHHTSAVDLGYLAEKAGVKKLVLSHILFWGSSPESVIQEAKQGFSKEVILAEDLMVID